MLTISILQPDVRGLLRLGMMQQGMLSVIVSSSRGQYSPLLQKVEVKLDRPSVFTNCLHTIHQKITGYTIKLLGYVGISQGHQGIYRDRFYLCLLCYVCYVIALLFNIAESIGR